MLCRKPYMMGIQSYGCGQCMPCRINRRRLWTSRLMLESETSGSSFFLTLTYDEENLPGGGTLVPKDFTLFLKRLRRQIEPLKLRYFGVGEYGDHTNRPHYHFALFLSEQETKENVQILCDESWQLGFTYAGELNPQSSAYIAGYVTKKMTSSTDTRLNGRHPEFARMSLRPGIGRHSMDVVGSAMQTDSGLNEVLRLNGDVPDRLMMGKKTLLLGRYLRRCLREVLGLQAKAPINKAYLAKTYLEYSQILEAVMDKNSKYYKLPTGTALLTKDSQSVINMEGRMKIKDGGKTI